jgi:hypothetical protein
VTVSSVALIIANKGGVEKGSREQDKKKKKKISLLFSIPGHDFFRNPLWEKLHNFMLSLTKEATRVLLKFTLIMT